MLITISEASKLSGVPETTIRDMIKNGKIEEFDDGKIKIEKTEFLKSIPTIISFFNQKGGVGKTSMSVLLSDYYDKMNLKTLIIDLDQQGNLSQTFLPFDEIRNNPTIYEFLEHHTSLKKIVRTYNNNIDIIPADIRLATKENIDTSILIKHRKEFSSIFKDYQIVIIDCPPALNSFSRLAILLSHYIFIPLNEEPYCFIGLSDAVDTINTMKEFNKSFINFYAFSSKHIGTRSVIRETMKDEYKKQLKDRFIDITIPNFIGIVERSTTKYKIFDMYPNEDSIKKIGTLFDEIYKIIYEER